MTHLENKKKTIHNETYDQYLSKFQNNEIKSRTQWIYEIIDSPGHDEILFSTDEFLLIKPIISYDMHLLAFVLDKSIKSLRDLNSSHVPMLERLHEDSCNYIEKTFKIPRNEIKVYIHYPPNVWLLHVHFTKIVPIDSFVENTSIEYSHSLHSIIKNIKLKSDYYQDDNMEILFE
jgi:m7GpppX diphosphatase